MSHVAWLDCSVGVAGDMLLAALIDAGADEAAIRVGLQGLGLDGWELKVREVHRGAFRALHASFGVEEADPHHTAAHPHPHDDAHPHPHDDAHPHRPWSEVQALLTTTALPERARARALAAYERLAQAEAALHGMPVETVMLHEVGSLDAILDVVGVCLALEDLGIDRLVATPLPMGTGHTHAAHGRLPLPAPATLSVLRGWPIVPAVVPGEWVTPTGAALVAALAEPGPPPAMVLGATGHGAGTRDPSAFPNLVRVVLGHEGRPDAPETVEELACNLDDLPGEQVPAIVARLLEAGALDAWVSPVHMKKGRPGLVLSALARPDDADALTEILLRHSTSLGVRRHRATRTVLDRWHETVDTAYGPVRVKVGGRGTVPWHAAPEYEDVAARAAVAGVPLHEVHAAALTAWRLSQRAPEPAATPPSR